MESGRPSDDAKNSKICETNYRCERNDFRQKKIGASSMKALRKKLETVIECYSLGPDRGEIMQTPEQSQEGVLVRGHIRAKSMWKDATNDDVMSKPASETGKDQLSDQWLSQLESHSRRLLNGRAVERHWFVPLTLLRLFTFETTHGLDEWGNKSAHRSRKSA